MERTLRFFCVALMMTAGWSLSAQNFIVANDDVELVAVGNAQVVIANVMVNDSVISYDQSTTTY